MAEERRRLSIGVGVARGLEQAVTNIYNIGQAREKLKREDEASKLDTKVKEAQIKKMEFQYGPEQLTLERDKLKATTAAQKSAYNLNLIKINSAEAEEKRKAEKFKTGMDVFRRFTEGGVEEGGEGGGIGALPEGVAFDFGDLSIRGVAKKETPEKKGYRDYVNKHLQAQASLPEKYRTDPMPSEEYGAMFSERGSAALDLTDDVIAKLGDYDNAEDAIREFMELKNSYSDAGTDFDIDTESITEAFREKFGDEAAEELRSQLGEV